MVFTASLLGARHLWAVVENKPASSLVVSLGKALNGTPPLWYGRQVAQTPRKWQLPSKCGRPVQNIAIQFAFSWMEDKYEQYNTKIQQKKGSSTLSLSQIMLFVIKLIGLKWLFQENAALYICFAIVKGARFGPGAVLWEPLIYTLWINTIVMYITNRNCASQRNCQCACFNSSKTIERKSMKLGTTDHNHMVSFIEGWRHLRDVTIARWI